jgi:hypothetical protein
MGVDIYNEKNAKTLSMEWSDYIALADLTRKHGWHGELVSDYPMEIVWEDGSRGVDSNAAYMTAEDADAFADALQIALDRHEGVNGNATLALQLIAHCRGGSLLFT